MKIDKLKTGYRKKIIINEFSVEIEKGEIISLIGPNGGGKSTLLKSISGQINPLSGSVFIGKENIRNIPLRKLSKRMSIITTERVRTQHMTCRDVVLSGRLPYSDSFGLFNDTDQKAANNAMELMKISDLSEESYEELSDGQKQRALIARAICQEPEYMIMDEPTSYLDIRHKLELMEVLRKLSSDGMTVIASLHEPQLALRISNRLLLVHDNGNIRISTPDEVLRTGAIKDLYGLTDEMYETVKKTFI